MVSGALSFNEETIISSLPAFSDDALHNRGGFCTAVWRWCAGEWWDAIIH